MEHWPEENRGKDGEDSEVRSLRSSGMSEFRGDRLPCDQSMLWPLPICLFKELRLVQQYCNREHSLYTPPGHGSELFWSRFVGRLYHVPNQVPNPSILVFFL